MDQRRNLLIICLLCLTFIMWQIWEQDHTIRIHNNLKENNSMNSSNEILQNKINTRSKSDKYITIKTDVLLLKINIYGGDIDKAYLLTYPEKLDSSKPFYLLQTLEHFVYQAQSGLDQKNSFNESINNERLMYVSEKKNYVLSNNKNILIVPLTYISPTGIIYKKFFILRRGDFALDIKYEINNKSNEAINLNMFCHFKQSIEYFKKSNTENSNISLHNLLNTACSTDYKKYQKYDFEDIRKKKLNIITNTGWIAVLQKYFVTAWILCTTENNIFYTKDLENGQMLIGFRTPRIIIDSNEKKELKTILWLGPEIQDKMKSVAPNLDLVVDYGWLWFLAQPLFKLLKFINTYTGNWGFSIIIITFIVRSIMYPLTKAQYTSMAKIRIIQPKLISIRERFSNDKSRQSQEIMQLYKSEKINPLGGCFPLIIQMPIFLSLYYMLSNSVELRHASFILWIRDLSDQDPYYVLPFLMGITMFLIQRMSPNTIASDPMQQKIMSFMPLILTIFFLWFPSGLVLYYTISNIVTIIQQKIIFRDLENRGLHHS